MVAGGGWAIRRTPLPADARVSFLFGATCAASMSCTAAGFFTNGARAGVTLAERWNGTSWSIQPTPYRIMEDQGAGAAAEPRFRIEGGVRDVSSRCAARRSWAMGSGSMIAPAL